MEYYNRSKHRQAGGRGTEVTGKEKHTTVRGLLPTTTSKRTLQDAAYRAEQLGGRTRRVVVEDDDALYDTRMHSSVRRYDTSEITLPYQRVQQQENQRPPVQRKSAPATKTLSKKNASGGGPHWLLPLGGGMEVCSSRGGGSIRMTSVTADQEQRSMTLPSGIMTLPKIQLTSLLSTCIDTSRSSSCKEGTQLMRRCTLVQFSMDQGRT